MFVKCQLFVLIYLLTLIITIIMRFKYNKRNLLLNKNTRDFFLIKINNILLLLYAIIIGCVRLINIKIYNNITKFIIFKKIFNYFSINFCIIITLFFYI